MNIQAFSKTLQIGKRCNVRTGKTSTALNRVITKFGRENRKNGEWFYWYWKKEGYTDYGYPDCGYAGIKI